MRRAAGATWSWLSRLWRRKPSASPPPHPGRPTELTVGQALAWIEGQASDALVHRPSSARAAAAQAESLSEAAQLNAFSQLVIEREASGARGGLALALGLALAGRRVAAVFDTGDLADTRAGLEQAAERLAPMVVYGLGANQRASGHAPIHALVGSGAVVWVARNGQHAADLALAARRLAEQALIPVVVAYDGAGPESIAAADDALVRHYLGDPRGWIPAPSDAQQILFGAERRRVPAWVDVDHPVAGGGPVEVPHAHLARRARSALFRSHLEPLARASLDALAAQTGRRYGLVDTHQLEGAELVLVAQGTLAANAWRVAGEPGRRIGVIALSSLEPLPGDALREALRDQKRVAVLEAIDPTLLGVGQRPPLWQALASVAPDTAARWCSVLTQGAGVEDIEALSARLSQGTLPPTLMLAPASDFGDGVVEPLPNRQALLDRVRASYPAPPGERLSSRERDVRPNAAGPAAVRELARRIAHARPSYDSLPRFWREVVQPAQAVGSLSGVDPVTAAGLVPAGASLLAPEPEGVETLPEVDPDTCTGCGRCWQSCPDSAWGASLVDATSLLNAASKLANTAGQEADALRRAHKHLAGRLLKRLKKAERRALDETAVRDAYDWVVGKLSPPDDAREGWDRAWSATSEALMKIAPVAGPSPHCFEHTELLVLAVDPSACLGCGGCAEVCPEGAIAMVPRSGERVSAARERFSLWGELPDTDAESLRQVAESGAIDGLAATHLARHWGLAQVGGSGQPGDGGRLALRHVTALAERHGQGRRNAVVAALEETRDKLVTTLNETLSAHLEDADLALVADALAAEPGDRGRVAALAERLESLGHRARFDPGRARLVAETAEGIGRARQRLAEGEDGYGAARFAVVLMAETVLPWAARHPLHPWWAPLTVDCSGHGAELARGIATAMASEHVALVRMLRRAELVQRPPADIDPKLERLRQLRWSDLDERERASCPPLMVVADEALLSGRGLGWVTRLMTDDLPIKVVVLDSRGRLGPAAEPALVAMAHRRTFVLAGSIAFPDHLASGLLAAFAYPGPALIHLHAPNPERDGFAPSATIAQARRAVEARAQVLFRYDPRAEGRFGLRASCAGNPGLDVDWGGATWREWAAGQARFEGFDPQILDAASAERLEIWHTLREVAGHASPFVSRIRSALERELDAAHSRTIAAMKSTHEAEVAATRESVEREVRARLTGQLMRLAGYPRPPAGRG